MLRIVAQQEHERGRDDHDGRGREQHNGAPPGAPRTHGLGGRAFEQVSVRVQLLLQLRHRRLP